MTEVRTRALLYEALEAGYGSAPPHGTPVDELKKWLWAAHGASASQAAWNHPKRRVAAACYHIAAGTGVYRRSSLGMVVDRWRALGVLPRSAEQDSPRLLVLDVGAGTGNLLAALASRSHGLQGTVIDYVAVDPKHHHLEILREGVAPDARQDLGPTLGETRFIPAGIDTYLSAGLAGALVDLKPTWVNLHFSNFHQSYTNYRWSHGAIARSIALHDSLLRGFARNLPSLLSVVVNSESENLYATCLLDGLAAAEEAPGRENRVIYPCPSAPRGKTASGCWRKASQRGLPNGRRFGMEKVRDLMCRAPRGLYEREDVYDLEIQLAHDGRWPLPHLALRSEHSAGGESLCTIASESDRSGRPREGMGLPRADQPPPRDPVEGR